jgi:sugar lactone lactonase YvrE
VLKRACLRFRWVGNRYDNPEVIATVISGAKKSIAIDRAGDVFVAVMGEKEPGYIIHVRPDGRETFFPTADAAIYLALDHAGNICIPSAKHRSVFIYNRDGNLVDTLTHGYAQTPADIMTDQSGAMYIPFWETGEILRISPSDSITKIEIIAKLQPLPGGMAIDSQGHIYVSNREGSIEMIY